MLRTSHVAPQPPVNGVHSGLLFKAEPLRLGSQGLNAIAIVVRPRIA